VAAVDAYNTALVHSTAADLSVSRYHAAGASVGGYALVAGGHVAATASYFDVVDAYNTALTRSTAANLSEARIRASGATAGGYALIAGGTSNEDSGKTAVDAYSASLVKSVPAVLANARHRLGGASIGSHALFAGGLSSAAASSCSNTVEAYNASLVKSSLAVLSVRAQNVVGARAGNYALFAAFNSVYVVDAYNADLVKTSVTYNDTDVRNGQIEANANGYGLFVGGIDSTNAQLPSAEAYNGDLVRGITTAVPTRYDSGASASAGDYTLVAAGGVNPGTSAASPDVHAYYAA
jgi:hypothetical protein